MSCPYCTPDMEVDGFLLELPCATPYMYAGVDGGPGIWVQIIYETGMDHRGYPTGELNGYIPIKYCPMCGKKLAI